MNLPTIRPPAARPQPEEQAPAQPEEQAPAQVAMPTRGGSYMRLPDGSLAAQPINPKQE